MSIQKKSLLSSLSTAKKAIVATSTSEASPRAAARITPRAAARIAPRAKAKIIAKVVGRATSRVRVIS